MLLSRFSSKCESENEDKGYGLRKLGTETLPFVYAHKNINFKVEVKINYFLAILSMV